MTAITPYNFVHPAVTTVTALSQAVDLSEAEYRQIYARVAAGRSLRNIELALRSGVSYGWWAKYATGDKDLDRDRKNELRRWSRENGGPALPDLPPTPAEAVAANTHPDAVVYRVGTDQASRVVLVGSDVTAVQLRVNGNCAVVDAPALAANSATAPAQDAAEPACNARYSHPAAQPRHRNGPRYFRPCLSQNPAERIAQLEALLAAARAAVEAA